MKLIFALLLSSLCFAKGDASFILSTTWAFSPTLTLFLASFVVFLVLLFLRDIYPEAFERPTPLAGHQFAVLVGSDGSTCERLGEVARKRGRVKIVRIEGGSGDGGEKRDPEEVLKEIMDKKEVLVIITSTHSEGKPPANLSWFVTWLGDTSDDFRVSRQSYARLRYAVFGVGDSAYGSDFNKVAMGVDLSLRKLGAKNVSNMFLFDWNHSPEGLDKEFGDWFQKVVEAKVDFSPQPVAVVEDEGDSDEDIKNEWDIVDVEDLGGAFEKAAKGEEETVS